MKKRLYFKKTFKIISIVVFIVGVLGIFGSVLFDIFYKFNNRNNNDLDTRVNVNKRIDFNDYNYDDIVKINVLDYDLDSNDFIYNVPIDSTLYNFKAQYRYKMFGYVSFYFDTNTQTDFLLLNQYTWSQLLGTTIVGGYINFEDNNTFIYDFYFSGNGTDTNYLNIYFTTDYILQSINYYTLFFNIGSSSSLSFDYSSTDLYLFFIQTEDPYSYSNGYSSGYNNGYSIGYNEGLDYGLNNSVTNGQEIYDNGFNAGYQQGFTEGLNDSNDNILRNALLTIFDVPIYYISKLLNFDLLGINFFGLFCGIITLSIALWLIQKVI